jgi:hypothetical protein
MSPHLPSPLENVNDFFNGGDNWLASPATPSPLIHPQDDIQVQLSFGLHASPFSPPHSPYILPSSAPTTYSVMMSRNPSSFTAGHSHSLLSHSLSEKFDSDQLNGMNIPGASQTQMFGSPTASFQDGFSTQDQQIFHQDSFVSISSSHLSESFPKCEEHEYSTSPIGWSLDSAPAMQKTESILSNESYMSRDTEDFVMILDDSSVCATVGTVGTIEPERTESWDFPTPSPVSSQHVGPMPASGKKKGRTRKLSSAERVTTAYMRKIRACEACHSRKLKVTESYPHKKYMLTERLVRRWNPL